MPASFHPGLERKYLVQSAGWALFLELLFLMALGLGRLPFFHSPFDSAQYIEAQILQLPPHTLTGAQTTTPEDEIVWNPRRFHPPTVKKIEPPKAADQNQVKTAPLLGATHGAIALYSPSPVIPDYLRNQNLKTSVIIEFFITAQGQVTPRLVDSSGNDELDAIALNTVKTWRFKPAAQGDMAVDSKSLLRIVFEVH